MLGSVRPASVLPISLPSSNRIHLFKSIAVTNLLIPFNFSYVKSPSSRYHLWGRIWQQPILVLQNIHAPGFEKTGEGRYLSYTGHDQPYGSEWRISKWATTSSHWSVEYLMVTREGDMEFVGLFFFFSFNFLGLREFDLYIKNMMFTSTCLFPLWL